MKKNICLHSLFIIALTLVGCGGNEEVTATEPDHKDKEVLEVKNYTPPPEELSKGVKTANQWHTGTLKFYNLEGGFFGFTSERGQKLLPLNLGHEYRQDGAILKIFGHIDNDIMTIQMWGKPFKVEQVEVIKAGNKTPVNDNH